MDDSFLSFYKRGGALPLSSKTPNTRKHHQSTDRLMKMDHRKSGKVNMVAASETARMKHPIIDQFSKTGTMVMPNQGWGTMLPIFRAYNIGFHPESEEIPTSPISIHGAKCSVTGKKIMTVFHPDRNMWTLFKR